MFTKEFLVIVVVLLLQHVSVFGQQQDTTFQIPANVMKQINIEKSEAAWLEELGPEKYKILRQCSTEPPFTGKYYDHKEEGTYVCAGCGTPLFDSDTKYESGSGWPSFFAAIGKDKIKEVRDTSYGMIRTEIKCATCDGHLGHVFTDGPPPTGLRYCVNSASMDFVPAKAK